MGFKEKQQLKGEEEKQLEKRIISLFIGFIVVVIIAFIIVSFIF